LNRRGCFAKGGACTDEIERNASPGSVVVRKKRYSCLGRKGGVGHEETHLKLLYREKRREVIVIEELITG